MILECVTVILVIVVASIMLLGKGSGYSVGVLPLVILPLMHIVGSRLSYTAARMFSVTRMTAYISIDVLALVVTCLFVGGISMQIKQKSKRLTYLVICGGFAAALCCVLIVNTLVL